MPSPNTVHSIEAQAERTKENSKPNYASYSALKDRVKAEKVDLNFIKTIEVNRTD